MWTEIFLFISAESSQYNPPRLPLLHQQKYVDISTHSTIVKRSALQALALFHMLRDMLRVCAFKNLMENLACHRDR